MTFYYMIAYHSIPVDKNSYLPLHLLDPDFLLFLPGVLQEKYPSSKPLRTGILQPLLPIGFSSTPGVSLGLPASGYSRGLRKPFVKYTSNKEYNL